MDNTDLVGVVTVTFNSASVIRGFMDSILKQSHASFRLYVVDNNSSDETVSIVSEYKDPRLLLIPGNVNVGVAEGNNIGIRAALKEGCSTVLLINNDTEFDSGLLDKLLNAFGEHRCEMVVPKIMYFDDPQRIWCAGGYFIRNRGSARHFGYKQRDHGAFDQPRIVDYSPTCCMLIKSEVFARVGLMDANYFVYFDDTDFCHRAHHAGVKLLYLPSAVLLHKVSSLTGSESDSTYRYTIRNHVYYCLKYFPAWKLFVFFPAYQIHLFSKFLIWFRKPKTFLLAERAFCEGISLFRSRRHQRA